MKNQKGNLTITVHFGEIFTVGDAVIKLDKYPGSTERIKVRVHAPGQRVLRQDLIEGKRAANGKAKTDG